MEASIADMLKWRARALPPTITLLALNLVALLSPFGPEASRWFGLLGLILLVPCGILWSVLVSAVFQTARRAFGSRAALGYATLAVVLMPLFGLGVFILPLMVEKDIRSRDEPPRDLGPGQNG